jgi:hypothetical protein
MGAAGAGAAVKPLEMKTSMHAMELNVGQRGCCCCFVEGDVVNSSVEGEEETVCVAH